MHVHCCSDFDVQVDEQRPELTYFAPPSLASLLTHTRTACFAGECISLLEELHSARFPYGLCKLVIVEELCAYADLFSPVALADSSAPCFDRLPTCSTGVPGATGAHVFAGLLLFDVRLLFTGRVLEQMLETRRVVAEAVAAQFFGTFLSYSQCSDRWLVSGLCKWGASLCFRRFFGENEFRYLIRSVFCVFYKYSQFFTVQYLRRAVMVAAIMLYYGLLNLDTK